MEAVGGGPQAGSAGTVAAAVGPTSQSEANAAVDHFFNSRGMRGLYIPLEVFKIRNLSLSCSSNMYSRRDLRCFMRRFSLGFTIMSVL